MLRKMTNKVALIATVAVTVGLNSNANAALSATAEFGLVGDTLTITLRNTSPDDVLNPGDVLTGLFLSIPGNPVLTPVSATLAPGSVVHFGPSNGGNVGGEWAYASGLSVAGFNQGISSAGLGIFGSGNFGGPNLEGPVAVNGGGYGLTSVGDNIAIGNAKVTGGEPLIQSGVVFVLSGATGLDLTRIGYAFQYGTDLNVVPEPSTVVAGALLLLPFAASTLRFVRKNRKA